MDGINRIQGVKRTLGIRSKITQRSAYRQQYVGTSNVDNGDPHLRTVTRVERVQKYKDNAGVLAKKLDRVLNYKEEYRHYYLLEQGLEEHFDEPTENMDFVDHLYVVLGDINEVILALGSFDKTFNTTYSQHIGQIIKNYESELSKLMILIHIDYTLGFFKGRMKKIYDLHPEYFDFLLDVPKGFIPTLIANFRNIKAIIPEKIEELSSRQDQTGAVIDHKL